MILRGWNCHRHFERCTKRGLVYGRPMCSKTSGNQSQSPGSSKTVMHPNRTVYRRGCTLCPPAVLCSSWKVLVVDSGSSPSSTSYWTLGSVNLALLSRLDGDESGRTWLLHGQKHCDTNWLPLHLSGVEGGIRGGCTTTRMLYFPSSKAQGGTRLVLGRSQGLQELTALHPQALRTLDGTYRHSRDSNMWELSPECSACSTQCTVEGESLAFPYGTVLQGNGGWVSPLN